MHGYTRIIINIDGGGAAQMKSSSVQKVAEAPKAKVSQPTAAVAKGAPPLAPAAKGIYLYSTISIYLSYGNILTHSIIYIPLHHSVIN